MLSRWHARAALGFCAQKYYKPPYNAIFFDRTPAEGLFADRPALRTPSQSATAPRRIGSAHLTLPLAPPERLRNDARARAMEELQSGVRGEKIPKKSSSC
jgi:hypothetical protein